jgi:DNA mismatch repair protein MutS2
MTYAGMPVPCEEAVIPFTDRVFADIGDDQSVVSSLSNFSAHIRKQAEIIRCATGDSLVLLDEVGSGTDPREGESLAIAILNELRRRGCMTVATTHYGRLKAYGKRHDDILIASVQFDMKKLEPTYRYMEGISGSSNAFAVAQRYGLPESIIRYATFLKNQAKTQEDELIERLEAQLQETAAREKELNQRLEEVKKLQEQAEKDKMRFEKERDEWRAKAEKEADEMIEEKRREADEILQDIREREKTIKSHEVLNSRNKISELSSKPVIVENDEDHEFEVGEAVELRSSGQVCEIISIDKKDIRVMLNGRQMRVKKSQIRPSAHVIVKNKPQTTVRVAANSIFSSMPLECNLIGMRVDEAMQEMAEYVDEAKVRGLKTFRIIHGDGSGALRSAVHAALKRDKAVKEFRLGMPNEGSTGATVVTLK